MASASGGAAPSKSGQAASSTSSTDSDAAADPLIPLEYSDAPNQRFYAVALFALQQSYKAFQFIESYISSGDSHSSTSRTTLLFKWALYDFITLWLFLPRLKIPRISFLPPRVRMALLGGVLALNWACIGDWRVVNILGLFGLFVPSSWRDYFEYDLAILEHRIRHRTLVDPTSQILGSATVHILPHSTAKLVMQESGSCYCVSSPPSSTPEGFSGDDFPLFSQSRIAAIPVLLNNTTPKYLQYSIQNFGEPFEARQMYNLTTKEIKQIASYKTQRARRKRSALEYDSIDEELEEEEEFDFASGSGNTIGQKLIGYDGTLDSDSARGTSVDAPAYAREKAFLRNLELEKSQAVWAFNVARPGIVRIERIIDKSDADVRIPAPQADDSRILVVPCPSAAFHRSKEDRKLSASKLKLSGRSAAKHALPEVQVQNACQSDANVEDSIKAISVDVFGYAPLKLTYQHVLLRGGKREVLSYTIDGIAPDGAVLSSHSAPGSSAAYKNRRQGQAAAAGGGGSQQVVLSKAHDPHPHGPVLAPQILSVPLNISLATPGSHQYRLEKVSDACGNSVDFSALRERFGASGSDYPTTGSGSGGKTGKNAASSSGRAIVGSGGKAGASSQAFMGSLELAGTKKLMIYPRSQVSFFGCGTGALTGGTGKRSSGSNAAGQPVKLLQGGNANLQIRAGALGTVQSGSSGFVEDSPWKVQVQFEPELPDADASSTSSQALTKQEGWTRELKLSSKQEMLQVDQPGRYRILGVSGTHCGGEVYEPSECTVYTPAMPSVDLDVDPITDSCAGEVGLKAIFSLSGEPPYKLHYSVQHGNSRPEKLTRTIRLSREEMEFRPDQTGESTYEFTSLDDANYQGIKIGRTVKQTVHPLAGVAFTNAGKGQKVRSCEGDEMQVPIELKGIAPWKVDYRIVGQKQVYHVEAITNTKHNLDVKIPPKIASAGGTFTLSIDRVVDGRGCSQPMAVEDLVINVHRTQPTATFAIGKKVVVKEGDAVHIPLRLTGEGPWTVHYRKDNETPQKATVRTNNGQIGVNKPGRYELVSVTDNFCPGTVLESSKAYEVEWLLKPTVRLASEAGRLVKNGSLVRPQICEGVDDTAGVVFSGQAPFFVTYDLIEEGLDGQKKRVSRDLQSIQRHAQFELSTSAPGHRVYEFTGISDSNYAQVSKSGLAAPETSSKNGLVRLEQDILARPSAIFVDQDRKPVYCVKDALDSSHAHAPSLRLSGAGPFRVELEFSPDGSQISQKYPDIIVKNKDRKVHLPQHVFAESGPYTIYLRSVVDSTGCARKIPRGAKGSFVRLDVADIASIAAVQPQNDHCVGDSIDFVLQGSAPWTVQYDFEGKKQKVTSKESRFSRVAESKGNFKILSVAHHQDSCKSVITDISKTIHPLPRARVQSADHYILREGDQAEIVFEFEGTPPFTFTYTKSAPQAPGSSKKGPPPTVLETHTVTNVQTHKYSIYTQSEGTWNVVSVQDAFCAYPRLGNRGDSRKMIQN